MDYCEIYGLYDQDGKLRYIGKANNAAARLAGHLREKRRRTPLYDWIHKMKSAGMPPTMRVLATVPKSDWQRTEKQLIFEARLRGEQLLNVADGGDEPFCSKETRAQNGRNSYKYHPKWRWYVITLGKAIKEFTAKGKPTELQSDALNARTSLSQSQKDRFEKTIKLPWEYA